MDPDPVARRLPIGAEAVDGGVHFRLWAPNHDAVAIVLESGGVDGALASMKREAGGYFSLLVRDLDPGAHYRFLAGGERLPDPASRLQPSGPHGPSVVVDPRSFRWTDEHWRGVRMEKQVVYEMHIGTFTREGNWASATRELDELARLGITLLEVMPIAEFAGEFGWGYDGVCLFAPTRLYGSPDDVRAFVDRAHSLGIGVVLDVVYNHLGPDGNYLAHWADDYFTDRHTTDWGTAINFDGAHSGPVREFFVSNAGYWIDEFHFDGLRLDATQTIHDDSSECILAAVGRRVRQAAHGRGTVVIAENEAQQAKLVRPLDEGGYALDAIWNDDFHHAARVALTGRAEAYYSDYAGSPQEIVSAVKRGFLYQGQYYAWQKRRRGGPALDLAPRQMVVFLENHDQVANSARGHRLHRLTSPGRHRAMVGLLLLSPSTPMLFQGEEFASSSPFLYFADHQSDLANEVQKGRRAFLTQFPTIGKPEMLATLDAPHDRVTFERSKLDTSERIKNAPTYAMYRDLIHLRRTDSVFGLPRPGGVDGAVLGPSSFVLRYFGIDGDDRLVLVNLGRDMEVRPPSEPLLAPPAQARWVPVWSSEDPSYGGGGTRSPEEGGAWHLLGEATVVLRAEKDAPS